MKKVSNKQLLDTYGKTFQELYLGGKSVPQIMKILNLNHHYGFRLKTLLNLHQERWQRVGMPEKFSEQTESLIYGTLMGDASIHPSGENKYNVFSLTHSKKQLDYLEHKRNLLLELKPYDIKILKGKYECYRFVTPPHPQFDQIRNEFYNTGTKQISQNILKKLTPQAIAWWFMDDGSSANSNGFHIATCSFNDKSNMAIIDFFKEKYGISINYYHKNDYPRLHIYSNNALVFKELIEPYVIPSLSYKLLLKNTVGTGSQKWSQKDIDLLKSNYKYKSKGIRKRLSSILNRSQSSIIQMITNLGLAKNVSTKD